MLYHTVGILKSNDSGILATVRSIQFTHLVVNGANNSILQVHARDRIARLDFGSLDDVHDDENTGQVDECKGAFLPNPRSGNRMLVIARERAKRLRGRADSAVYFP